ncbi:ABC transporter permease [Salinibaculum rarum]|uniref:ABC transporter permease n=1 Tax=Salinibaculum rarum TaxID=3058903 RepID=UPI002660023F|nr:ABC transporter permease subunit [Salinibaculum sp. KK48]
MSIAAVARKGLKATGRSQTLWAGAITLGIIAVLLAFANQGTNQSPAEAVKRTFHTLTIVLSLLLPIVALVASYLAIAGEREGGGIKFLLSLPNQRRAVFLGKLLSRLVVVAVGIGFIYVAATSVSLTKHGAFPAVVIFGTLLLTLTYGSVFVSIAVWLSAGAASRSRAVGRALTAYFVLVLLYLFPIIQISSLVRAVHTDLLGMETNPDLYNAIEYTSPYRAYQKATNLVVPDGLKQRPFLDSAANADTAAASRGVDEAARAAPELPVYLTDEMSLLILAFWLVVPVLLGIRTFNRAELE